MKSASGVPTGRVVFQEDDALVLVGDAQLEGGADHGIAGHAADLASASVPSSFLGVGVAVEEHGAGQGEDDLLALSRRP